MDCGPLPAWLRLVSTREAASTTLTVFDPVLAESRVFLSGVRASSSGRSPMTSCPLFIRSVPRGSTACTHRRTQGAAPDSPRQRFPVPERKRHDNRFFPGDREGKGCHLFLAFQGK